MQLLKDTYGYIFTMKEFIEDVSCGYLTDYDGLGRYSDGLHELDKIVDLKNINVDFDYVVWYNR